MHPKSTRISTHIYIHIYRKPNKITCIHTHTFVHTHIRTYIHRLLDPTDKDESPTMTRHMMKHANIKCVCVGTRIRAACMHANTLRILLFVLRKRTYEEIVALTAKDTTDDACHYNQSVISAFCWGFVPVTSYAMWS